MVERTRLSADVIREMSVCSSVGRGLAMGPTKMSESFAVFDVDAELTLQRRRVNCFI